LPKQTIVPVEVGFMEKRIMAELSFTGCSYPRVAQIYRMLDTIGLDVAILPNLPNIDCGNRGVLIIPKGDLKKARDAFERFNIHAKEKEVLVLHVENEVGTIAGISRKIGDCGISINYAYLGRLSSSEAFLVLGCSDNKMALKALDGKPPAAPSRNKMPTPHPTPDD
jgi:hypothetical protein